MSDRDKKCRKQFEKISKKVGKAIFQYKLIEAGGSVLVGRIELIRPLLLIPEKELTYFATLRTFRNQEKTCPYDDTTKNTCQTPIRHPACID